MEKRILVFGDSNSYGFDPVTGLSGGRFDETVRWPRVMETLLGKGYRVIEDAVNGRTTAFDDPIREHRNGVKCIDRCFASSSPIDMVIVMLGTNDLKTIFSAKPLVVMRGLMVVIEKILASKAAYGEAPKVLIAAPIDIGENILNTQMGDFYEIEAVEYAKQLRPYYEKLAKDMGVEYIDAGLYGKPCELDCIHMDKESHAKVAEAMAKKVKEMIG